MGQGALKGLEKKIWVRCRGGSLEAERWGGRRQQRGLEALGCAQSARGQLGMKLW